VWAQNEATGEQSLQEVTHLIQGGGSKELIDIYLHNGEKITTTYNHNFYLPEEMNWFEARELVPGQKLIGQDRQLLEIRYLGIYKQVAKVYNLSVNNDHTYYVGREQALVHNANCDLSKIKIDGIYPFKPKPKLEINNAHVPGKPGYYPGKGTLPEDWQIAFDRYALFDGKAWWANGQNGAIYRYFKTQGRWHWSGSTKDAMRPLSRNDIPSKVIGMLGGPSKGNL
jgi:hypothetical protein